MFLIDRPAGSPGLRADLAPRALFGGTGDLVRAALVARPPAPSPVAPGARPLASQLDLTLTAPARRRRVG
jgi:hypothetical protein